jgi:redox-sensitive bicupin YhaK (pirin superfamily)
MPVRVVRGEVGSKSATTRTVLPSGSGETLPPFERVAETVATPRRRFPPHRHEGVEVLTYVTEGSASYVYGSGAADPLAPGAVRLLTAPTSVSHTIEAKEGSTVRWFAAVVPLAKGAAGPSRLQSGFAQPSAVQPDGTVVRHVLGPPTGLTSAAGLECVALEFRESGTAFQRVGHDRVAVCYVLSGEGKVDNRPLEVGEAALVEDSAAVAVHGLAGFRTILLSAPHRPTPSAG